MSDPMTLAAEWRGTAARWQAQGRTAEADVALECAAALEMWVNEAAGIPFGDSDEPGADVCEGCGGVAVCHDSSEERIPLCDACFGALDEVPNG